MFAGPKMNFRELQQQMSDPLVLRRQQQQRRCVPDPAVNVDPPQTGRRQESAADRSQISVGEIRESFSNTPSSFQIIQPSNSCLIAMAATVAKGRRNRDDLVGCDAQLRNRDMIGCDGCDAKL